MGDYWIPPDEELVEAQVRLAMVGYKPPEVTAEMIGVYAGSDPDPSNKIVNPHYITASQF